MNFSCRPSGTGPLDLARRSENLVDDEAAALVGLGEHFVNTQ
jgi:hypothetical protein